MPEMKSAVQKKQSDMLFRYVQNFFQDHLGARRGLSPNTILAYRDTLKLCLKSIADQYTKSTTALSLDDLNAKAILSFLDHIESGRKNNAVTRNQRLAGLRTFFRYLAGEDPSRAGQYQAVTMIPLKRAPKPMMEYLDIGEVDAILKCIDRTSALGRRDYLLLSLLYNTGARVQEIVDLRVDSLRLAAPAVVTIIGKGRKKRAVPLWEETTELLRQHIAENKLDLKPESPLFENRHREPLGRFGVRHMIRARIRASWKSCPTLAQKRISPHTFRHTTAMHLLQAGVDLATIQSWLGHVDISTTHEYVEIDMEMKRKALSKCGPISTPDELRKVAARHQDVISWLEKM